MMVSFLFGVLREAWGILEDASVFLLFGFLLAGLLGILVPGRLLTGLVGTGKIKSVLWGSVVGAPIPLCSCGVLPTALGLRKQGATPGATVAFLIATPETGVDSISLTYALTDPVMTVFRPIAGVATAIAAGLATNLFGVPRSKATEPPPEVAKTPTAGDERCQHAGDPGGHDHAHRHDHHDDHVQGAAALAINGLSPGAVLVFLLAGPATNIGSLVVLLKVLGRHAVAAYLVAVVIMTLAAGFALNAIYQAWGFDPRATFGTAAGFVPDLVKQAGAVLLTGLLILSMCRTHVPNEWVWLRGRAAQLTGIAVTPRGLGFAAAAGAAVLWLGSGLFTVGPGEVGMRLRFGRILASDLEPGLHVRWPWPFENHRLIVRNLAQRLEFGLPPELSREEATRAQLRSRLAFGSNPAPQQASGVWFQKETAPGDSFLLTGDSNLIDLRSTAQYRVNDALAFAYHLAEPEALVRSTILAALRGAVATRAIDAVYTTAREEIERETRAAAQAMLDRYQAGIEVLSVSLLYDHPPDEVHDAFRDVASSLEDKLRTINLANVFAVEKINQAKGEAAAMTEGALAFKEQRIAGAQADANAFVLRLEAYEHAPGLTKFRLQLETLEDVLPGMRKFVRPGSGDVKDFDMWLVQPFGSGQTK